jgi:AraC-like DNA-binding protein
VTPLVATTRTRIRRIEKYATPTQIRLIRLIRPIRVQKSRKPNNRHIPHSAFRIPPSAFRVSTPPLYDSSMPSPELLTFKTLYDSPMISVRDYICRDLTHDHSPEEESEVDGIVLMRHGAFARHFGKKTATADVNRSTFFAKDSVYTVSHPGDCGDRGTSFVVADSILVDIIRELDPSIDEHPDQKFPFTDGPVDAELFMRHRDFVRRLEQSEVSPLEPLWADITGLQLIADVIEAAYAHSGAKPRKRPATLEDHAERTEAAKAYLANRIGENVTLDEVASAVACSPFNFARIFQQQTGLPLHRYLTRLRLRAALERLPDAPDITSLALELGFSSHSHFTEVFRREFGKTPSEFRRDL